jgi:hypothetical protein
MAIINFPPSLVIAVGVGVGDMISVFDFVGNGNDFDVYVDVDSGKRVLSDVS